MSERISNCSPEVVDMLARKLFEPTCYCGLWGPEHPCYAQFYGGLCNYGEPTVDGYCDNMQLYSRGNHTNG